MEIEIPSRITVIEVFHGVLNWIKPDEETFWVFVIVVSLALVVLFVANIALCICLPQLLCWQCCQRQGRGKRRHRHAGGDIDREAVLELLNSDSEEDGVEEEGTTESSVEVELPTVQDPTSSDPFVLVEVEKL